MRSSTTSSLSSAASPPHSSTSPMKRNLKAPSLPKQRFSFFPLCHFLANSLPLLRLFSNLLFSFAVSLLSVHRPFFLFIYLFIHINNLPSPPSPLQFQFLTLLQKVVYCETMSNPTLRVANIPVLSSIAHERNALLVVDNTFCPLIVSPLRLGADVVVYSITKFINGASDLIAGKMWGDCGGEGVCFGIWIGIG